MRKKDFDKLFISEKDDFEELIKSLKGRGDREKLYNDYRFLNPNYTKDLYRSYTQEVIFKILTKGSGKRHLSILMDYLVRELSSQKDKEKCDLFDHNNEIIDADSFDKIIDDWSYDFEPEIKEENPILEEALIEFDKLETVLENKYYDSSLTKEEGEIYVHIKSLKENKHDKDKIEDNQKTDLAFGEFCYSKEDHKYGILIKEPDYKYPLLVTTDNDLNIKEIPIADVKFVQSLNKDMEEKFAKRPRDFSHIILSAGGDKPNEKSVDTATKQFLEENFKEKGFEYVYTTHKDTDNLHTHVIVNNYNKYNGYKFSPNKFELQQLRLEYRNHLDNFGINRTVTYKIDRKNYLENLQNEAENIKNVKSPYMKDKLKNIENHNFDILKFRKNSVNQIDRLSDQLYKKGEHKLATELLKEKDKYEIVEVKQLDEVLSHTRKIIEDEAPQIAKITKENFMKRIGKSDNYRMKASNEVPFEVLERYQEYLEKTKENTQELYSKKMTPALEEQQEKAIEYLDKRIRTVSRESGIPFDEGGRSR